MVLDITDIPFLPIQLFRNNEVKTLKFDPQKIFESSGTTSTTTSRHFVKDIGLYKESFIRAFELFYGDPSGYCIIGLLPSYLERNNSSLVFMVQELITQSQHGLSGFYLDDHEKLYHTLLHNEIAQKKTLLIGVTFALIDFALQYKMNLANTIIMETGGMKGRLPELTRAEVHTILKDKLSIGHVHSEYGMTELLSQAYARKNGIFKCPPWMLVLIRGEDDPLLVQTPPISKKHVTGVINIIDLANLYSCAFLATDDIGSLHHDGTFEVLGRTDASDLRGCSLLTMQQL